MDESAALAPETSGSEDAAGRESMTVYRFLRETRAGATAIAAVAVTMMTLGGAALIVDHVWLVHQRDLLKSATDAAAIAATLELQDFSRTMSDEDAATRLQPVAERYVWFNLAGNLSEASRTKMSETLDVEVEVDQSLGSIDVTANADLGGTLLSRWLYAYTGPKMTADSGVEGSLGATEIVLAIDTTGSMNSSLDGSTRGGPDSRMSIVKKAAVDLVDVLESFPNSVVAVGIVPWTPLDLAGSLERVHTRAVGDRRVGRLSDRADLSPSHPGPTGQREVSARDAVPACAEPTSSGLQSVARLPRHAPCE